MSKTVIKQWLILIMVMIFVFLPRLSFAYEKIITIPAESKEGTVVELEQGEYNIELDGGAMAVFYPINPHYCWLAGVAVGTDVEGGQDEPNIGTLYYEPDPKVYSQAEAEQKILEAVRNKVNGTYLQFSLQKYMPVRFWVSDFDYTDNSGMIKVKIVKY